MISYRESGLAVQSRLNGIGGKDAEDGSSLNPCVIPYMLLESTLYSMTKRKEYA